MKTTTPLLLVLVMTLANGCGAKKSTISKSSPIPVGHDEQSAIKSDELFINPENTLKIKLYNPDIPEAAKLKKCAFANSPEDSCTIATSPLLGMNGKRELAVSEILDKTMATRVPYMETFKTVLDTLPKEVLRMFGSVNAIVISEQVQRSFYSYKSGALYLEASLLWRTTAEKSLAVKDSAPLRTGLPFSAEDLYIKGGKLINESSFNQTRTANELAPTLISVLIHELTHANDYFSEKFYNSKDLQKSKTYYATAIDRWNKKEILSAQIKSNQTSKILRSLGRVLSADKKASEDDLRLTARDVLTEYRNDPSLDLESAASAQEDMARLVQDTLMYHYHGFSHYFIVKKPNGSIAGGTKNKIASSKAKDRAKDALEKIFKDKFIDRDLIVFLPKVMRSLNEIEPVDIPEDTKSEDMRKL